MPPTQLLTSDGVHLGECRTNRVFDSEVELQIDGDTSPLAYGTYDAHAANVCAQALFTSGHLVALVRDSYGGGGVALAWLGMDRVAGGTSVDTTGSDTLNSPRLVATNTGFIVVARRADGEGFTYRVFDGVSPRDEMVPIGTTSTRVWAASATPSGDGVALVWADAMNTLHFQRSNDPRPRVLDVAGPVVTGTNYLTLAPYRDGYALVTAWVTHPPGPVYATDEYSIAFLASDGAVRASRATAFTGPGEPFTATDIAVQDDRLAVTWSDLTRRMISFYECE